MQGKRGGLKDTLPDDMLATVFTATLERTGINPAVSISSHDLHFQQKSQLPFHHVLPGHNNPVKSLFLAMVR